MKFYIDTANVDEIRRANDMGIIAGVTTNPSLIAKEGRDYAETLKRDCHHRGRPHLRRGQGDHNRCRGHDGPRAAPSTRWTRSTWWSKIPMTAEGLKAIKVLSGEGIPNCTLIFAQPGAAGTARRATYVSPFLGRLDDIGQPALNLIEIIHDIFLNYPDHRDPNPSRSVHRMCDLCLGWCRHCHGSAKVIEQMVTIH